MNEENKPDHKGLEQRVKDAGRGVLQRLESYGGRYIRGYKDFEYINIPWVINAATGIAMVIGGGCTGNAYLVNAGVLSAIWGVALPGLTITGMYHQANKPSEV